MSNEPTSQVWNFMSKIDHPKHYKSGDIECIDAIEAQLTAEEFRGFLKGNVLKYMWRERIKGGTESLCKAQWYLNKLIGDPKKCEYPSDQWVPFHER